MFLGLSHTPRSDKGEISFNINDPDTYSKIVNAMDDILTKYESTAQKDLLKYEDCGSKYINYSSSGCFIQKIKQEMCFLNTSESSFIHSDFLLRL